MKKLKALMLGMREIRYDYTSNCEEAEAYDRGRDVADRITLRKLEMA